jgi:hypothetical protein
VVRNAHRTPSTEHHTAASPSPLTRPTRLPPPGLQHLGGCWDAGLASLQDDGIRWLYRIILLKGSATHPGDFYPTATTPISPPVRREDEIRAVAIGSNPGEGAAVRIR